MNWARVFIGVGILAVVWIAASATGVVSKTLLASPWDVYTAIQNGFAADATPAQQIHVHALHTIYRACSGWLFSLMIAIPLGIALGASAWVYAGAEGAIELIRSIPPILAFPLLLVAFNFGDTAYLATILFGCTPIVILTIARATQAISPARREILRVYRVPRHRVAACYAMELVPGIFLGGRLAMSMALIITVVSEMVFTPRNGLSLGALARDSQIDFNTPAFYACVLFAAIFGLTANMALKYGEHRLGSKAKGDAI